MYRKYKSGFFRLLLGGSSTYMLIGIQTGHMSQEKKINPIAAHQTMNGSASFKPIHTWPSINCCSPANTGIMETGRYLLFILLAFQLANAPPPIRPALAAKLTLSEKHMKPT